MSVTNLLMCLLLFCHREKKNNLRKGGMLSWLMILITLPVTGPEVNWEVMVHDRVHEKTHLLTW